GWQSVRVSLEAPLEALRRRLDGKWRNMLSFAERSGLTVEMGSDQTLFEWLLARYEELVAERGFAGIDPLFLRRLHASADASNEPLILRASAGGVPVAGVYISCHGATATYLVGWNGLEGRKLKANQLLLWRAMEELKRRNLQ